MLYYTNLNKTKDDQVLVLFLSEAGSWLVANFLKERNRAE